MFRSSAHTRGLCFIRAAACLQKRSNRRRRVSVIYSFGSSATWPNPQAGSGFWNLPLVSILGTGVMRLMPLFRHILCVRGTNFDANSIVSSGMCDVLLTQCSQLVIISVFLVCGELHFQINKILAQSHFSFSLHPFPHSSALWNWVTRGRGWNVPLQNGTPPPRPLNNRLCHQ